MAYTKQTWQTGDTITAEKLNNIESGIENAQWQEEGMVLLFSETVTTEQGDVGNFARLSYSEPITADELTVTFDGVEYTCPRIQNENFSAYGGIGQTGPDFSEYPFALLFKSNTSSIFYNAIHTETAGEHTVSVAVKGTSYLSVFTQAVADSFAPLIIKLSYGDATATMDKTYREIYNAVLSGRSCLVRDSGDVYDGELKMVCYVGGSNMDTQHYEVQVSSHSGGFSKYSTNSVDGYPTSQG